MKNRKLYFQGFTPLTIFLIVLFILSFDIKINAQNAAQNLVDSGLTYKKYKPKKTDKVISRSKYMEKLYGFWLGECIANWTGLVTEMDKIGNIGDIKTGAFYTRDNWGKADHQNIWGGGLNANISPTIDFVFRNEGERYGVLTMIPILSTFIKTFYIRTKLRF